MKLLWVIASFQLNNRTLCGFFHRTLSDSVCFCESDWGICSGEAVSKIDILVATPGRLMDHLTGTRGFSLASLRYLVIDEADRLLSQSYQDWLPRVLDAAERDCLPVVSLAPLGSAEVSYCCCAHICSSL